MLSSPGLEVLLPVHDQAESIEAVIRELHAELSPLVRVSFIVCEDGSRDDTRKILRRLANELPIRLHVSDQCKGYPRTVCEGMDLAEAKWLLCVDADGRFDPKEFSKFWQRRAEGEVLLGRRLHRTDTLPHQAMSRVFYAFYQSLFHVPVHDPSCPYVLCRKAVAHQIAGQMREMQEGFWWEFAARAHRARFAMVEIPVRQRPHAPGITADNKAYELPGIFLRHLAALFRISSQTSGKQRHAAPKKLKAPLHTASVRSSASRA